MSASESFTERLNRNPVPVSEFSNQQQQARQIASDGTVDFNDIVDASFNDSVSFSTVEAVSGEAKQILRRDTQQQQDQQQQDQQQQNQQQQQDTAQRQDTGQASTPPTPDSQPDTDTGAAAGSQPPVETISDERNRERAEQQTQQNQQPDGIALPEEADIDDDGQITQDDVVESAFDESSSFDVAGDIARLKDLSALDRDNDLNV